MARKRDRVLTHNAPTLRTWQVIFYHPQANRKNQNIRTAARGFAEAKAPIRDVKLWP